MTQNPVDNQQFESFPEFKETPEEIAFEVRAQEGALWTGGRLLIGIWAFVFAALAFAYFYLRSANNENLWRPHGITAPTAVGAAIFASPWRARRGPVRDLRCGEARRSTGRWPAGPRSSADSSSGCRCGS